VLYQGSKIDQTDDSESSGEAETGTDTDTDTETDAEVPNTPDPSPMPENGSSTALDPVLENTEEPDNDDKSAHTETQWQVFLDGGGEGAPSQLCVYDVQSNKALEVLRLPPLVLDKTTGYYWRSRYLNSSGTAGEWADPKYFTTGGHPEDADGDGILDDQAMATGADLNADGVADETQSKLLGINTILGGGHIAVDALADDRIQAIVGVQSLDPADPELMNDGDGDGYDLPLGLLTFKLALTDGARNASVSLHLSHAPSEDMALLTFDGVRGWQRMADLVQLLDDGKTALLSLTDGGSEDVDGVENGIIIFSGGYGRPVDYRFTDAVTGGSRGRAEVIGAATACFIGSAGF
jgi:hypothetical protein